MTGDSYAGHIKMNRKHGQGVMTWATGDVYDGNWKDDRRSGEVFHIRACVGDEDTTAGCMVML